MEMDGANRTGADLELNVLNEMDGAYRTGADLESNMYLMKWMGHIEQVRI